jgi:glutathione peroxidase
MCWRRHASRLQRCGRHNTSGPNGRLARGVLGVPRAAPKEMLPAWRRWGARQGIQMSIYDFTARLGTGQEQSLSQYRGKVLLIVNVASKCGFTPQYKGLQSLYQRFGPLGLEVLAFPCDQFGHQEPGSDAEIATFCDTSFGVTFPLFAKIEVNGRGAHPLYAWLKQQKSGLLGNGIKWNFTKFMVDKAGAVRSRHAPTTPPESLTKEIETLL